MPAGESIAQSWQNRSMAMHASVPRILVAGTGATVHGLQAAVAGEVRLVAVHTLEEAMQLLHAEEPHLVVVGYHFDELRPFRFIQYAREQLGDSGVPIMLVRALPVHLGATTEAELRESYHRLGVHYFFNLFDEAQHHGHAAAVERLRDLLRGLLAL